MVILPIVTTNRFTNVYEACEVMSDVNNGHETYHTASRPA